MAIDNRQLRELMERLKTDERFLPRYQAYRQVNREKAWQTFCRRTGIPLRRRLVMRRVLQYAAVVLIALGTGLYFLNRPAEEQPTLAISAPPEGKAVLTLADGRTVSLDEASDSLSLPQVANATVGQAQIVYRQSDDREASQQYNTLATDKDGEFRIELPDGTRVHLNASSRLTYPLAFEDDRRVVRLEGEAYFEIAKDAARPFFVQTGEVQVQQFGTSFNLRAYTGREVEVVLVEGSVQVQAPGQTYTMQPGELTAYNPTDGTLTSQPVNTSFYTAWHTGRLQFEEAPLGDIMTVLSRWYDVQVRYGDEAIKALQFSGRITRHDNLLNILELMVYTQDMTFTIEDEHTILIQSKRH